MNTISLELDKKYKIENLRITWTIFYYYLFLLISPNIRTLTYDFLMLIL